MLEIDMTSRYGILFVRLFGDLTFKTRKKLNEEVLNLIINVGVKNVVFNLENVNKMDSSGYKTLIKCYKTVTLNDGLSFLCFNKRNFDFDFKGFNKVSDEMMATHIINV